MRSHRNPSPRNAVKIVNRQRLIFAGFCLAVALLAGITTFLLMNFGRNDKAHAALGSNMGFENNLTEWTPDGSWSNNSLASYVRTGSKSAKASWTSGADIEIKNTNATLTAPAAGVNYMVVIAYAKSNNSNGRLKLGVVNTATNVTTMAAGGYTTVSSAGFTKVTGLIPVVNGATYAPVIACRGQSGSTDVYVDDVHMYTTTLSAVDATAPAAPKSISISTSGTQITLNWVNGNDAETGLDGVTVLRYNGAYSPDMALNDQATYHATTATIGATTASSWKVVYQGGVVSTLTDNPGSNGIYTYMIYMRDKAFNYTASVIAARAFVFNGSGLSSSLSSSVGLDGLHVASSCTFTTASTSTVTFRSGAVANVHGTLVDIGNFANNLGATVNMQNGSVYKYSKASSYTPVMTANWLTGSTLLMAGAFLNNNIPGLNQTFHHVIWNSPNQAQYQSLPSGFNTTGDLSFVDSGPGTSDRIIWFCGTHYIGGNLSCSSVADIRFKDGSKIIFNGAAPQTINIQSGVNPEWNAVTFDNPTSVQLMHNITVDSMVYMCQGSFNMNSKTVYLKNNCTVVRGLGSFANGTYQPSVAGAVYNLEYTRGGYATGNELTSSTAYLNNLILSAPSDETVTLDKTANVNNALILNNGKIQTNGLEVNVVNTGTGAVVMNSVSSYVVGNLRRAIQQNGTYSFPVGKTTHRELAELKLQNIQGTSSILVRFTSPITGSAPNLTVSGSPVNTLLNGGYWTVTPNTQPASGSYHLTMYERGYTNPVYSSASSNNLYYIGLDRTNGTSPWSYNGITTGTTQQVSGGTVTVPYNNLTVFGDFAIGYGNAVLPITLSAFNATLQNDQTVRVTWSTSAEINNAYFSLERSVNGVDFEILNEQEGAGNSTTLLNYAYVDAHPVAGTNYYRLKQVDFDGTFAYGPVRQVTLTGNVVNNDFNASGIAVYPNPSTGLFSMHATSHVGHGVVRMKVLDAKGQTMVERAVDTGERTQLDMRDFPSGIYMAAFTDANGKTVVKQLVVERR